MAVEFGTAKTVLILTIVVGCFAVLWPKLFYPMLQASVSPRNSGDSQACCDVIFENDVNAIKVITELCGTILHQYNDFHPQLTQTFNEGKLTKEIVNTCRNEVLSKCGVDITSFLNEKGRLGHSYKQILDEVRSFNSSVCLKLNFGVNLGSLGAPRRMRLGVFKNPKHYRQERPPHMRPELLHPALRERGRAIPQSHVVTRTVEKEPRPPIPGMRPPLGGPGHVVPAPKGSSTMGIIMPIYTIGIVLFFMYTILKVMFKKPGDPANSYSEFTPDPEFRKMVFENYGEMHTTCDDVLRQRSKLESASTWKTKDDSTKLGDVEIDHLRKRLEETEAAMERIVAQMGSVSHPTSSASASASAFASGAGLGWAKEEKKIEKKAEPQPESALEAAKPKAPVRASEAGGEAKERPAAGGTQEAKGDAAEDKRKSEEEEEAADAAEDEGAAAGAAGAAEGAEEEEEEDKGSEEKPDVHLVNDAHHDLDDTLSATNYTTASAAAEATGTEETAADFSAMESIGPDDEQQEDLDAGEEVWNGDVLPGDEEDDDLPLPAHHH